MAFTDSLTNTGMETKTTFLHDEKLETHGFGSNGNNVSNYEETLEKCIESFDKTRTISLSDCVFPTSKNVDSVEHLMNIPEKDKKTVSNPTGYNTSTVSKLIVSSSQEPRKEDPRNGREFKGQCSNTDTPLCMASTTPEEAQAVLNKSSSFESVQPIEREDVKSNRSFSEKTHRIHVKRQDSGGNDVSLANLLHTTPLSVNGEEQSEINQPYCRDQQHLLEIPQNLKQMKGNLTTECGQREQGRLTVALESVYQESRSDPQPVQRNGQESAASFITSSPPNRFPKTGLKIHTSTVIAEAPEHSVYQPFPFQHVSRQFTPSSHQENNQMVKLPGKNPKSVCSNRSVVQNERAKLIHSTEDERGEVNMNRPTRNQGTTFAKNQHIGFGLQETKQSGLTSQQVKSNNITSHIPNTDKIIIGCDDFDVNELSGKAVLQKIDPQGQFHVHQVSSNLKLLALMFALIILGLNSMWLHAELKDMKREISGLKEQVARFKDTENTRPAQFHQRRDSFLNQKTSPENDSLFTKLLKYVDISENSGRNKGVNDVIYSGVDKESDQKNLSLDNAHNPSGVFNAQSSDSVKSTDVSSGGKEIVVNVIEPAQTPNFATSASKGDRDYNIGALLKKWGTDGEESVDEVDDDDAVAEEEDDEEEEDTDDDDNDEDDVIVPSTAGKKTAETNTVPLNMESWRKEITGQNGAALSRHIRAAGSEKMDKKKVMGICKKAIRKNKKHSLRYDSFEGNFFSHFDFSKSFLDQNCITVKRWPSNPIACRENVIKYKDADTPLAFYRPTNHTASKKQKTRLIEESEDGNFTVLIPGVYLLHTNITVVDVTRKKSIGIFLNGQAVMACQQGGFRCPNSNSPGSHKYRICNIDGVFELSEGDRLEVRTMNPDTHVRLESHQRSIFRAVLLHEFKRTKGKKRKG